MGQILVRIGCLAVGLLLMWKAYLFSPWHEPFPFGNFMCSALACASLLSFWAAFRIHRRLERRAIIAAAAVGLVLAWLSSTGGVLYELIVGKGNLSPMVGIFVVGPLGFIVGTIGGAAAVFLRRG